MNYLQKKLTVFCLVLALLITGCKKSPAIPDTLTDIQLNGKLITLAPKDELQADAWNELEVTYNNKSYNKIPVLYKGITIGSKYEDVIEAFDIKAGYALIDRETATSNDGCTDIIVEEYKNKDFFESESILDACFVFGYEQKDGAWNPIPYKKIKTIYENEKENTNVLLYQIDICGSQMPDEEVGVGRVIQIKVTYA